jgi:hypothetical protein
VPRRSSRGSGKSAKSGLLADHLLWVVSRPGTCRGQTGLWVRDNGSNAIPSATGLNEPGLNATSIVTGR